MKQLLFILTIGLMGCTISSKEKPQFDETLIYDQASNWHVNLDSLGTVDNYILTYRELRRKGIEAIKPYITTSSGHRISLRELREPKGSGYFFDCRAHLWIFINQDGSYLCIWNTGKSCNQNDLILNEKTFDNTEQLRSEILRFYTTNSPLELSKELDPNDLEIWITPADDNLPSCKTVIENAALAYQEFQKLLKDKDIPFYIVISSRQDEKRMNRILKKEKNISP